MIIPKFEIGQHIPHNIYQICPNRFKVPDTIHNNISKIKQLNLGWGYELFDDETIEIFILNYYGKQLLEVYQSLNFSYGAARADLFRYLLMYAKGGVYLDLKSSMTKSLDSLLVEDDLIVLSKWNDQLRFPRWGQHPLLESYIKGEYQQWHIICVAGHPLLRNVILQVVNNIQKYSIFKDGVGKEGVLKVTGPIAYTLGIENLKSLHCIREVDVIQEFGFIYNIYENQTHETLFKKHYTKLKSPVVKKHLLKYMIEYLFYSVWVNIKRVNRKILTIWRPRSCG